MNDEIFIDSNILIYSFSQNLSKCQTSRELLLKHVDRITVTGIPTSWHGDQPNAVG